MLRFLTSGESHGKGLVAILESIPAGLKISEQDLNSELARRQKGYGRGQRMQIEKDEVEIFSGVRDGKTLGSPITLIIRNKDWKNWQNKMSAEKITEEITPITKPRPGHADFCGYHKFLFEDIRDSIERSSARETAARVACGAVAKIFLKEFKINIYSWVTQIGNISAKISYNNIEENFLKAEQSLFRCPDNSQENAMKNLVDKTKKKGDTLGGIFEVVVTGVPIGLGSYMHWDKRLDGRLAQVLMSIPAIKGVEIGLGFASANLPGSKVHDEIFYNKNLVDSKNIGYYRLTNNAGGLEGGITNGENIVLRAVMKPISSLLKPLKSVDLKTKKQVESHFERSDVCAVPAAAVVGESVVALEIANSFLEKFGGDSLTETKNNFENYLKLIRIKS